MLRRFISDVRRPINDEFVDATGFVSRRDDSLFEKLCLILSKTESLSLLLASPLMKLKLRRELLRLLDPEDGNESIGSDALVLLEPLYLPDV